VAIDWRPILVGGVFNAVNQEVYAARATRTRAAAVHDEGPRGLGALLRAGDGWPTVFPVNSVKAMRGALVALRRGRLVPYARPCSSATGATSPTSRSRRWWRTSRPRRLRRPAFLERIEQPALKERLRRNTEELVRAALRTPTMFLDATTCTSATTGWCCSSGRSWRIVGRVNDVPAPDEGHGPPCQFCALFAELKLVHETWSTAHGRFRPALDRVGLQHEEIFDEDLSSALVVATALSVGGCATMDQTQHDTARAGIGAPRCGARRRTGRFAGGTPRKGAAIGAVGGAIAGRVVEEDAAAEEQMETPRGHGRHGVADADNRLMLNIPSDISSTPPLRHQARLPRRARPVRAQPAGKRRHADHDHRHTDSTAATPSHPLSGEPGREHARLPTGARRVGHADQIDARLARTGSGTRRPKAGRAPPRGDLPWPSRVAAY